MLYMFGQKLITCTTPQSTYNRAPPSELSSTTQCYYDDCCYYRNNITAYALSRGRVMGEFEGLLVYVFLMRIQYFDISANSICKFLVII